MAGASARLLGGYEVLAELDSGGMGEVLIARKRAVGDFERLVALKTVRSELAEVGAAREMFLDEGRLLARLHHRGIAQVYDFGEDGDRLFLAMEYVAGIDFDSLAERLPPPRIACLAMAEALRALHAAHELADRDGSPLGVVHRDVSPGNLMLTFDGQVKVLDFGIALMRNRRAPVTEFGMLKGKPPYMAPEQVRSEAIDPRTDVFSACAVLWELLTGERLFTGDSIYAIGRAIEQGTVDPPSWRREGIPEALDALVLQGLSKNPDERFQSASSLATALESVARTLGTESLDDYARRELAADKAEHEEYVARLFRSAESRSRRVGRGTSVNTIPALPEELELGVADTASAGRPEDQNQSDAHAEPIPQRSRWPLALVALAMLGASGLLVWQFMFADRENGETVAVLDGSDASALPPDAALIPATVDSAPTPEPADAAPATDAPPKRDRTKDAKDKVEPKKKRDAGPDVKSKRVDAAPAVDKPTGFGTLTMLHQPGDGYARVFVDGRFIRNSPAYNIKLSAGPHSISWVEPDGQKVRTKKTVVIVAGEHKVVRATKKRFEDP